MINELSSTYFKNATKKFYISGMVFIPSSLNRVGTDNKLKSFPEQGAPQCPFPDAWLGPQGSTALATAAFDYIFVQFCRSFHRSSKVRNADSGSPPFRQQLLWRIHPDHLQLQDLERLGRDFEEPKIKSPHRCSRIERRRGRICLP